MARTLMIAMLVAGVLLGALGTMLSDTRVSLAGFGAALVALVGWLATKLISPRDNLGESGAMPYGPTDAMDRPSAAEGAGAGEGGGTE